VAQVLQEIVGYGRDGNVINIQFISFNEEQEQVERTFKDRNFNGKGIVHDKVF
jgi:hypothetical protein